MSTTLDPRSKSLEHARWRVQFATSLLKAHQAQNVVHGASWREKEAEYRRWLEAAKTELLSQEGISAPARSECVEKHFPSFKSASDLLTIRFPHASVSGRDCDPLA
jgi:hypothetical protein